MFAKCNNLYIDIDGRSIEFMQYLRDKIFWYGYLQESDRMSDVSIRCHHHNVEFNDNPKQFISYIVNILYIPLKKENISQYSLDDHQQKAENILRFVSNGICQICALYLASELQIFLPLIQEYTIDFGACHLIGNILTTILQYPCVAMHYFRNKCDSWKYIMIQFVVLCNAYHVCYSESYQQGVECFRNAIFIFGVQILRNSSLFNQFHHWNINAIGFMQWIVKEIELQINTELVDEFQFSPLLNVYFMILSYFYMMKRKHLKWNVAAITIFRKQLFEIINHKIKDYALYYYFNVIIKFMCKHLLEITDVKYREKALKKYCKALILSKRRVWKEKRLDMKCLWHKCYVKAKHLETKSLYKCSRCKVARYCSKKCQKKDWNIGYHQELCDKYIK